MNMKKILLFGFLIFLAIGIYAQTTSNQTNKEYSGLWKDVKELKEKNLPQSANQVITQILQKAMTEKNFDQILRATIYRQKFDNEIDFDKNSTLIFDNLNKLLSETTNSTEKAIVNSLLGELYTNYYQANRWDIDNKTELIDYVPTDMQEWTKNIFRDKITEHFDQSVKDKSTLIETSTDAYRAIIKLGENSEEAYPTLYDFLMNRAIDQLITADINTNNQLLTILNKNSISIADLAKPTDSFITLDLGNNKDLIVYQLLQKHLISLKERNLNEGTVFTELKRNQYSSRKSETYKQKYALDFLLVLEKQNQKYNYNVEIIDAITDKLNFNGAIYRDDNFFADNTKKVYDWLNLGISRYPDYDRIDILKEKLEKLVNPTATITGLSTFYPDDKSKTFQLKYRNLNNGTISVLNSKKETVYSKKLELSPKAPYLFEDTTFTVDIDKVGEYKLSIEFEQKEDDTEDTSFNFRISKIACFSRDTGNNSYEFYVVDRKNSSPIKNATITIYSYQWSTEKREYIKIGEVITSSDGLTNYTITDKKENTQYVYTVQYGDNDRTDYTALYKGYWLPSTDDIQAKMDNISIFTDRSIYRPGQTLYFKAVLTKSDKLVTGKPVKVILYNANRQQISEQDLKSNEFGSVSGQFVLPQGGLTGNYMLQVNTGTEYIRVEEYKRPTFQVTFDQLKDSYSFGDSITLTGKVENYSGIKVQDATVQYTIVKSPLFRWWMGGNSREQIDEGSVTTNADGTFTVTFQAPLNDTKSTPFNINLYNFEVTATVTDLNGETQTGNYNLAIGDVSMILSTNIPKLYNKNSDQEITISAQNLNGADIAANGTYTIYSLQPNDSINKTVHSADFTTGVALGLTETIKKLPSAKYKLSLKSKDEQNREVTQDEYFTVFSYSDKKPPIETNEWIVEKSNQFDEATNAEIIIGFTSKDITILYDLIKDNEVLDRKQFKLSDENKTLTIPYKKEYGKNVSVLFTYVVDGTAYKKQIDLTKKEESKDLKLKWEVFRDKVRPGDHEEWKISVKENSGKPAFAELLASMYDVSLDKLNTPRSWQLTTGQGTYNYVSTFNTDNSFDKIYENLNFDIKEYQTPNLEWDNFRWKPLTANIFDPYTSYLNNNIQIRRRNLSQEQVVVKRLAISSKVDTNFAGNAELNEPPVFAASPSLDSPKTNTNDIRSNFDETAFFYPQLNTNADGEVSISFTVPGSNTTWKFRALAYDKSLNTGTLESLIVSQKQLMVTPNIPRFMRENDRTSISTKVSNLSDSPISGKVRLEFFNPVTEEVSLVPIVNQSQDFSLDKDASSSVTWTFDVPTGIDMLGCRIIAESETFSDGEQHVIAVLPNKMLVTESMSMQVNANQSKDFVFDKLLNNTSKTLTNYRLTLEYTNNPAWYAVQALPTLSNPQNDNSIAWFASYYVNTLGASITKQYPKVSNVIKAWKQQRGNQETLISNLQKNEELKTILLEETPWVLDAQNETEQMNRLALLFDLNNTTNQTQTAIDKLSSLQNSDGGWSWYQGMYSSRSITQYILYGFTQLINLGAVEYTADIKTMQINALKYIDSKIRADFENLKKNNKDWKKSNYISTNQLEYLYVRSSYRDIPIDQPTREAEKFYTSIVEKNWTKLGLYQQSLLATLAFRNGNKELSSQIMRSISEHSTSNDNMGMYWANNKSSVFMSMSAISVHTFIMDAFKETHSGTTNDMDRMKLWLLKQKQTQIWESTHATIDAIYALLNTGSDWLSSSGQSQIQIAGQTIEPKNQELGTGYFKETWSGKQISKEMAKVNIKNPNPAPAWGALYWQYYEDLNNITSQKSELNVDKKLFIDRDGKLYEANESNPIKVGDKVTIRLTVRTDRDMEFVQLKDMRAACLEPIETLSGMKWQNKAYYYQSTLDASTNFFFDHLPKGTYVFEYSVYATRSGEYSNGITSIQCMYAPEFVSHTAGIEIIVSQ